MVRGFFRDEFLCIRMQGEIIFFHLEHFLASEDDQCGIQREPENLIGSEQFPFPDRLGFPVLRRIVVNPPGIELLCL